MSRAYYWLSWAWVYRAWGSRSWRCHDHKVEDWMMVACRQVLTWGCEGWVDLSFLWLRRWALGDSNLYAIMWCWESSNSNPAYGSCMWGRESSGRNLYTGPPIYCSQLLNSSVLISFHYQSMEKMPSSRSVDSWIFYHFSIWKKKKKLFLALHAVQFANK